MEKQQIFNFERNEIRTIEINKEPYFVGKDVANILGYINPRKALADHVDSDDKGVTNCDTLGGKQTMTIINESGLYSLIFGAAKQGKNKQVKAKLLKQNGLDMGQNKLFAWLRDHGYLIRRKGTDYNMPTQRAMEQGLFEIKETAINRSNGTVSISKTPK
ncbi:UNVERIFIED_CONTAM: BRO family protein, partial [Melissococcus plutonius]